MARKKSSSNSRAKKLNTKPASKPAPKNVEPTNEIVEEVEIVESMDTADLPSFEKEEPIVEVVEETKAEVTFEKKDLPQHMSEDEIKAKITQFNRFALGQKWTSKGMLVDNAKMVLGADIEVCKGIDPEREVYFMYKGHRVPTEGMYFIRLL